MVQNMVFYFQGVKVDKNHLFFTKKSPRITGFHELTPKVLSIFAGLILHVCGV